MNASFFRYILAPDASLWHKWDWNPDHNRVTTKCLHNIGLYWTFRKETQVDYLNMAEPILLVTPSLSFAKGSVVFGLFLICFVFHSNLLFYCLS